MIESLFSSINGINIFNGSNKLIGSNVNLKFDKSSFKDTEYFFSFIVFSIKSYISSI